jgi:hypothetical protein
MAPRKQRKPAEDPTEATDVATLPPVAESADGVSTEAVGSFDPAELEQEGEGKKWAALFPHHGIALGDGRRAHFTVHRKFKRVGIFLTVDKDAPEGTRAMFSESEKQSLNNAGFDWRREDQPDTHGGILSTGAYFKQLVKNTPEDPYARSKHDRDEQEFFVNFCNDIRAANNLEPIDYSFAQGRSV